ncbi:MAG TPA: tetratricopeptide repeat protein [Parvularculaceae bacterium]|nr:tetratricopeptide repeat protein [Parvularculaceae bacterium]
MTAKTMIAIGLAAILGALPAAAQMSITTLGQTDAVACYHAANDNLVRDTADCDRALANAMSRSDRKKTLVNRGIILNRKGDLQAAIDDFNAALAIDPALGEALVNRGNSYFLGSRLDDALADYQKSLEFGVSKPWAAWYNIGLVHEAKKDKAKARDAYEKALELNPNFDLAKAKLAKLDG